MKNLELITPGVILWEEFMVPLEITQNQMARDLDITVGRINDIIHGRRSITADTALRLSKYFGTSPEFWLNLQDDYDIRRIKRTVWPTIEPRIRTYAPQSSKKHGQRGLRSQVGTSKTRSGPKTVIASSGARRAAAKPKASIGKKTKSQSKR
jgi:addiction module HigA family antidote